MSDFLSQLLARLADVPADDQPQAISDALNDAKGVNPNELSASVLSLFDELTEGDAPATEDTLGKLEILARIADGVQVLMVEAEERTARAHEIGERLRGLGAKAEEEAASTEDEPSSSPTPEVTGEAEAAPEAPAAEETPDVPESPAALEGEIVTSGELVAAQNKTKVPLGVNNSKLPEATQKFNSNRENFTLVAAADVPGFATGQKMTGLGEFAQAWESRMMPLISAGVNSGQDGQRSRIGIARIQRNVPEAFTINNEAEAADKLKAACDERNLPGGSLVAAAGWCAPSETLYDLCPIRLTNEGLISLPSLVARRGGIRYPADFDWAAAWSSIGFYMTETEAIAGTEKPCIEVPCPTDFEECRMDIAGLCIRTPILMERGWPERIQQFMEGAMLIHQHRLNARMLARMEELSTKIVIPAPDPTDITKTIIDPHGPGAIESLLSVLELQVQYQRYHWRLSQNDTLEMIAPFWLRGILKSDLRKKLGIDNRWSVTDAVLDQYLRNVGVNPQWVYDWQDSFSEPLDPAGFGGEIPLNWPTKVKIMLYPAGTFFRLQADVINLDGVYDHASLVQNVYTSLFTEEGWAVCARCLQSYVLEIGLCPNGLSGAFQSTQCCEPPAAPAPTP